MTDDPSLPPYSEDNTLLTPADTAAWLSVGMTTLANWRHRGRGPAYSNTGGKRGTIRYRLSDLKAFYKAHVREPTAALATQLRNAHKTYYPKPEKVRQRTLRSAHGASMDGVGPLVAAIMDDIAASGGREAYCKKHGISGAVLRNLTNGTVPIPPRFADLYGFVYEVTIRYRKKRPTDPDWQPEPSQQASGRRLASLKHESRATANELHGSGSTSENTLAGERG